MNNQLMMINLSAQWQSGLYAGAATIKDPANIASGENTFQETDLSYSYINSVLQIKRSYKSGNPNDS